MPSAAFQSAYDNAKNLKNASQEDMLELYAYAKVAQGDDINKASKPGMFDLAGKAKRNKWQALVDQKMSANEADKKYVEKFEALKGKHGLK